VKPGESCLLSGSCLLGETAYDASGIAETDVELLVLPPAEFHALMASDDTFRRHVFALFSDRLAGLMQVVEAIAYQKLDQRLAALLVNRDARPARSAPRTGARRARQRARIVSRCCATSRSRWTLGRSGSGSWTAPPAR
jgi:CRP/FNR family transcriptional regulator